MSSYVVESLLLLAYWVLPITILVLWLIAKIIPKTIRRTVRTARKLRHREPLNLSLKAFWLEHKDRLKRFLFGTRMIFRIPVKVILLFLYTVGGVIFVVHYTHAFYQTKPNMTFTSASKLNVYTDERVPITVYFDKPINQYSIKVNTAPQELGSNVTFYSPYSELCKVINNLFGTSLQPTVYTGVSITPNHSIPYDSGVIYYLTGIQSLSGQGGIHEQAITLDTPKYPEFVTAENLADQQKNTSISDPISLVFDQPIIKSLYYRVAISPETNFSIDRVDERHLQIIFDNSLDQGKTYTLTVSTAPRNVDLKTFEDEILDDVTQLYSVTFTTVTPAGIKQITPTGTAADPRSPIRITFSEPMMDESVLSHITFSPEVSYNTTWIKNNEVLELSFPTPLEKDTRYTLTLSKDTQSVRGGILGKDIIHKFETAGKVKVTGYSPSNGSRNASTYAKIQITFDQQIDKASAQGRIAISPATSVRYSWKGNTLTVSPKSPLKYLTKYIVTVKPGVKSIYGLDSTDTKTFSFTTKSQVVTIRVPAYKQGMGTFDCNLVALQMALGAKGISASVSSMKAYIGYGASYNESTHTGGNPNTDWIDHYGVHWDPVARYARHRGRGADVKRSWSVSGIAREINAGNPVVIFWYNGLSNQTRYSWHYTYGARPGLHSVVVYGYRGEASNPSGFYIHDPWPSFYQEYYSTGAFLNRWSYFGYTAVVVK